MILVYAFLSNDCTELEKFTDFDGATAVSRQLPHLVKRDICHANIKDHASQIASVCVVLTRMPD